MNREKTLRRRIQLLVGVLIIGLCFSGATGIPLPTESRLLTAFSDAQWLSRVHSALIQTQLHFPFLFYGTDWLAFGHFVIAIAFIGALINPVRNRWLFDFGLIACGLVAPWALIFGAVRGIPFWWRLIDCSFGVFGFIPVWFCRIWAKELEQKG